MTNHHLQLAIGMLFHNLDLIEILGDNMTLPHQLARYTHTRMWPYLERAQDHSKRLVKSLIRSVLSPTILYRIV